MTTATIDIRMLGPLEAWIDGGPVQLGGPKQRALVAILLLHANDVVPLDVLIDELWDGTPPPSAPAYVQNCVSRLRKVLGADTLETRAPGYRLRIAPDQIDARRFEQLVREARAMPARERAAALREALALWRGTALSDLAYWSFAQDAIRNLDEQRVNAQQMRLESELELGLHREAIGELDALVREHATHERLRWLQMLALHRSDRRQDALAAYQEARLAIVEESGMEPGEELRALQRRILQDDPTLRPDGAAAESASERPTQLARKVVAVCIVELLVDEELDVEAARGVVSRGLASLEEIALRHGGVVQQLLGEEAVVVLGLPAAHEDDLLRALRSMVELRDALSAAPIRAAVETGEVLLDQNGAVLSGTALKTARRVKESATEGEILLGPAAASQSVGAAWTQPSDGGALLVELVDGAPAIPRRPDAPLVGRRAELEKLVLAVRESQASSSCRRIVVVGEPGIGKTRLAAELVRTLEGEVRVLTGRCVPYAEGATYLPLAEIVGQLVGDAEPHARLAGEPDGELAATRLTDALAGAAAVDSGDVFWATRRLLEATARERPLLLVLEDLHWAEPTFLDLLEYLDGWSAGAPIAVVCLARTELLDARPAWAANTVALRPLANDETVVLLDALPESLALEGDARAAVVTVAEGNPLFLEQLAAHALDGPLAPGAVPASLESLLASRLDRLEHGERAVLERAAVVGREFTRAAVDAVGPDEGRGAASALLALVRRRLVRPDSGRGVDDAFLFDHALIRDATYAAISKTERAHLHVRLARWLERRGELDEMVGHHLEQAVVLTRDAGDDPFALVSDAVERLRAAGERAVWSRDNRAAVQLLSRAAALLPRTDSRRLEIECLATVPWRNLWEMQRANDLIAEVERCAAEIGDRRIELRARCEQVWARLDEEDVDVGAILAMLDETARLCESEGDGVGVARAWHMRAMVEYRSGRFGRAAEAAKTAADRYAGVGAAGTFDVAVVSFLADGTAPLSHAITTCESRLSDSASSRSEEGLLLAELAVLKALVGSLDESLDVLERSRTRMLEMGDDVAVATWWSRRAAHVAVLARDPRRVQEIAHPALVTSEARADAVNRIHLLAVLAEAALLEGDHARARDLAQSARLLAAPNDVFQAIAWRLPLARSLVACGELDGVERLVDEALAIAESTDHLLGQAQVRLVRAEVLAALGRADEALADDEAGAELLRAKGATLLVERAESQVASHRRGEPGDRAPLERG